MSPEVESKELSVPREVLPQRPWVPALIELLAEGATDKEAARALGQPYETVRKVISREVMPRVGARSRREIQPRIWKRRLSEAQRTLVAGLVEALQAEHLETGRVLEHLERVLGESAKLLVE